VVTWVVAVVAVVVAAVHGAALCMEDRLLLHPRLCKSYVHYPLQPESRWRRLSSGALVLTLDRSNSTSRGDDVMDQGRELLFCHGNGGNLDDFEPLARRLADRGYRVRLLEYAGFGAADPDRSVAPDAPSARTVVADTAEAWTTCVREPRSAILAGFSLGGGTVTQLLARLPADQMPGQVVLINTFYSLPGLVQETVFASGLAARMMRTQWCAAPGLARFRDLHNNNDGWSRTVIVATRDDEMMRPNHALQLLAAATPQLPPQLSTPLPTKGEGHGGAEIVWLPEGGHCGGPAAHSTLWFPAHAPPP